MADHHDRQARVLLARALDDRVQVVDELLEVLDQHALALGLAVADVIGPDHDRAALDQRLGDVVVAPDVLTVAVHQHDDPLGVGVGPDAQADPVAERGALAHGAACYSRLVPWSPTASRQSASAPTMRPKSRSAMS